MPMLSDGETFEFFKKCSVKELEEKIAANELPVTVEVNLFSKFMEHVNPLGIAAEFCSIEIISKMLNQGYSCKIASTKYAIESLVFAVHRHDQTERIKVVNLLIENGADIVATYRSLFKFMLHPELHDKMVDYVKSLFEKAKTCEKFYSERFNALRTLIKEGVFSNLSQEQTDRLKKLMPEDLHKEMTSEISIGVFEHQMLLAIQDPKKLLELTRSTLIPITTEKYLDAMSSLHSTPPDYDSAHKLFAELEASSGHLRGFLEYAQGYCFQYSKGKPKNFKRAVELYETALKAKDTFSKKEITTACLKQLEEMAKAYQIPDFDLAAVLYANQQIALKDFSSALNCLRDILAHDSFKNLPAERQNSIRYLSAKCAFHLQQFNEADHIICAVESFQPEKSYQDVYTSLEELRLQGKQNLAVLQRVQVLQKLKSFNKIEKNTQNKFNVLAAHCAFSLGESNAAYTYIEPCDKAQQLEFYNKAFYAAAGLQKDKKFAEAEAKLKLLAARDYGPAHFALAWFEINTRAEGSDYLAAIDHYKRAALSALDDETFLIAKQALKTLYQDQEQTIEHRHKAMDAFLAVTLAKVAMHPAPAISESLVAMKLDRLDDAILWSEKFINTGSYDQMTLSNLYRFYSEKAEQLRTQGQPSAAREYLKKAALRNSPFGVINHLLKVDTTPEVKSQVEVTVVAILLSLLAGGSKDSDIIKLVERLEKAGCVEAAAVKAFCLEYQLIKPHVYYLFSARMQAQALFTEALLKKPESFVLQLAYFNYLMKLPKPDVKQQLFAAASVLATQELNLDPDYQDDVNNARNLLTKFANSAQVEWKILALCLMSYVEQTVSENKAVNSAALTDTALRSKYEMEIAKTMTLPKKIRDLASAVQTAVVKSAPKAEASTNSGQSPVTPQQLTPISRAVVAAATTSGFLAAPSSRPAELPATTHAVSQPAAPISREVVEAATTTGFLAAPSSKPAELPSMPNAPNNDLGYADTSTKTTVKQAVASLN